MDTAVQNAITAVSLPDDTTAQRWFDALCATYQALDQRDWDHFTSELSNQASSAGVDARTVEQFVQQMTDNDSSPLDTIGQLVDLGNQLPALYQQFTAAPAGQDDQSTQDGQGAASTGLDEDAWHTFLGQNGPYWNGDDAVWDQFRTWFAYQAEQQGLTDPANGFLSYVESQSDKIAAFAQYGIQIAAATTTDTATTDTDAADTTSQSGGSAQLTPDADTFPVTKVGDSGEWVDYLDAMLRSNGF